MKTSLYGSAIKKIVNSSRVTLPKNHFEYFKNNTLIPIYSKFREGKYNILLISHPKHIDEKYHEDSLLITVKKQLMFTNDALDYLNNPEEIFLLGMLDKLEIWNKKDFDEYDKLNSKSLEELFNDSDLEEFENIPF